MTHLRFFRHDRPDAVRHSASAGPRRIRIPGCQALSWTREVSSSASKVFRSAILDAWRSSLAIAFMALDAPWPGQRRPSPPSGAIAADWSFRCGYDATGPIPGPAKSRSLL